MNSRFNTIVIGGGQAGLSVGYHLARRSLNFVILDASQRIGDSWRNRWDSLRLFTPARFNGLDGLPYPAPPHYFPTKDEMADYLEDYAARFHLPVQSGMRVERVTKNGERFVVTAGGQQFESEHVVVAMANYQQSRIPPFATQLDPAILQLHSAAYRSPAQLQPGPVLIVGAGNSGSELAMELARHHPIFMAGRSTGQLPFRIEGRAARLFLVKLVLRFLFHRVLTVKTPMGRAIRLKVLHKGGPLIRVKQQDMDAAGVQRVPRLAGVQDGLPLLADGRSLEVANVLWCTGYQPGFSWIDLPGFTDAEPPHERGVVHSQPGLFFVGLHFLYSLSSSMIHGVGRDADFIAGQIAARSPAPARAAARQDRQPSSTVQE